VTPPQGHAVISGGSSGIGLALARRLVEAGWKLTLLARNAERLEAARQMLSAIAPGASIRLCSVDVAEAEAVAQTVRAAIAAQGPLTLVIASAGMVVAGRFDELPLDAFRRSIEVNYLGIVHLLRAVLPAMRAQRQGRVVLIASGAALFGLYGYTAYAPSKFAVRGLAEALRGELEPDGIGVSIAYPPDTDTPQLAEEQRQRPEVTRRIAAGASVLSADAVAAAILRGIARDRFVIASGWRMRALAPLHSLVAPLLYRLWIRPLIGRLHGTEADERAMRLLP
jgi:3-dehydrosphinganine reductase